ncbi:unnamed protein product [Rhizoctonia solani]|uniref:DUF6533 domain-containing protein n=1 Tax=Rhizoctonia solani TaxID=456999 RepID=A0A8H3HPF0_9AGAM|nr:unnamed protein product [Rhizoctonia solani]
MSTTPYSPELIASLETALHGHTGRHVPAIDCLNPLFTLLLVVGYALLVYDHILTFTDEVQFIWKAKRSPVVIMFLLNRYITPIVLAIDLYDKAGIATYASHRFCVTWYFTEAMWYIVSFGMTHALVAMRASSIHILRMLCKYTNCMRCQVMAIWGRPRWIVFLLSSLWLAYFCTTLGILLASLFTKARKQCLNFYQNHTTQFARKRSDTVHFEPLLKVCYLTIAPFLWTCWVPPLLLEIVLFSLSCIQAFQAGKFTARTPIIHVLFRDACSVFNMITWIVAPPNLVALAKYFSLGMVNVMISRMVLNLRSCQAQSRAHHFIATPGGGLQMQISADEVELSGVTLSSKVHGQELEAGTPTGLSPSRSTFK